MCFVNPVEGPILRLGFFTEAFTLLPPFALPLRILQITCVISAPCPRGRKLRPLLEGLCVSNERPR